MKRHARPAVPGGFTLVELVSVILLIGILSATVLPRFMNVSDDAHDGVVDGLLGAFQSGVALFRAQYVAEGSPPAGTTIAGFGDGELQASAGGYPAGSDGGIRVGSSADCIAVFQEILQTSMTISAGSDAGSTSLVEAVDFADAATDILAVYYNIATNPFVPQPLCVYAYMRQYASAVDGPVPRIDYDGTTGTLGRGADL